MEEQFDQHAHEQISFLWTELKPYNVHKFSHEDSAIPIDYINIRPLNHNINFQVPTPHSSRKFTLENFLIGVGIVAVSVLFIDGITNSRLIPL
jgi:hypothetical protein